MSSGSACLIDLVCEWIRGLEKSKKKAETQVVELKEGLNQQAPDSTSSCKTIAVEIFNKAKSIEAAKDHADKKVEELEKNLKTVKEEVKRLSQENCELQAEVQKLKSESSDDPRPSGKKCAARFVDFSVTELNNNWTHSVKLRITDDIASLISRFEEDHSINLKNFELFYNCEMIIKYPCLSDLKIDDGSTIFARPKNPKLTVK